MSELDFVVLKDWPGAMDAKQAAIYLSLKEARFRTVCSEYPDRLRAFNLIPNGEKRWTRTSLDDFLKFREAAGVEKVG